MYKVRGSSNLLVGRTYSIVALRMSFFLYQIICCHTTQFVIILEELVNSSNLQSILFKVLRTVYLSSLNVGQWRGKCEVDSISKPQLHIGFKQS